ncbi:hypothetical protein ElyMa_000743200 [Elysia marginata]|uniref:Uncharacterized protein n=1 Tax=Elysia marginata TaxID=1093978 RepID=A0AAV4GQ49_9GAST|nr:hypothetical protein ElyMa_000743200 [Elysia marginata]
MVQHVFPCDDKALLVPVLRSVVSQRHSVVLLGGEEGVGDAEVVEWAEIEQSLAILILFDDSEVIIAVCPEAVVRVHSGIKISEQNQVFFVSDASYSFIKLPDKDILDLWRRTEGGGVGDEDVSWRGGSVEGSDLIRSVPWKED